MMQHVTGESSNLPSQARRQSQSSSRCRHHDKIFDGYNKRGKYLQAFDDVRRPGNVRGPYKGIFAELSPADAEDPEARSDALGRAFIDQGITFSLSGQERPFPLDLVPRVIRPPNGRGWRRHQTAGQALEMYLDDIYGDQEILRDGVIPPIGDLVRALPPRDRRRHRAAGWGAHPTSPGSI